MTSSGLAAEIKSKLPVVDVVGETVALKRAGSAYKGLCPFHAEKTPSFVVSPDRESWHCFGCGEGGDIFTFLMRRDGLDFREALARLAEKAGVELSERTAKEDRRKRRLREALEGAIAWYREVLLQAHQAERARAYLDERGLSAETLERFTIGYAPNTWDALTRRLIGRGFNNDELIGAGLASASNRGGVIDKFRGRIIIPIRDASGRAVGLGGRIMPGAEGPKYLNSPAGPLFDKSRTLYGIDLAKSAIRREKLAVIVEGYTDVMAAHQAGFANVVASLGTALTAGQIQLAMRYAESVAIAYDVDLAGQAATTRELVEAAGESVSVHNILAVRIPDGKDPDELLNSNASVWSAAVEARQPVLESFMNQIAASVPMNTMVGRSKFVETVLPVIRSIRVPIQREPYVIELAKRSGFDEGAIRDALTTQAAVSKPKRAEPEELSQPPLLLPLERELLTLLMRYPGLAGDLPDGEALPFRDATAVSLALAWRSHLAQANGTATDAAGVERFVEGLDPATAELARDLLARLAFPDGDQQLDADTAGRVLRTTLLRLRIQRLDEDLRDGRLLLEEAQRDGDQARLDAIEKRLIQLGREKAEATREMHEPAEAAGVRRS